MPSGCGGAAYAVGCSLVVGAAKQVPLELEYSGLASMVVLCGGHESHLKRVHYKVGGWKGLKAGSHILLHPG